MKNKGRRHKSGHGHYADGNCKGNLCGITRPITQMSTPSRKPVKIGNVLMISSKTSSAKWIQKKWNKRVRGYFKSQTKEVLI